VTEDPERHDGPTEVVETESGELIERLSGSTATLLLVWLIGIGALSTLLTVWIFVWAVSGERLGLDSLFSGFGFYTALGGGAGPCVLWLAGRAQGHSLRWFLVTALKIGLVMLGVVVAVVVLASLIMAGAIPGPGAIGAAGLLLLLTALLSTVWALATWSADRWIARARVS
jgi:hypothetical protein